MLNDIQEQGGRKGGRRATFSGGGDIANMTMEMNKKKRNEMEISQTEDKKQESGNGMKLWC